MMPAPPKVVYDCNIFVQSLINLKGPAGRCLEKAKDGHVLLIASPYVLAEVREIHLKTPAKYGITAEQTDELARHRFICHHRDRCAVGLPPSPRSR